MIDPRIPRRKLFRMLLAERDWMQADLARGIGISRPRLNGIINGKFRISLMHALALEALEFGNYTAEDWMEWQLKQELAELRKNKERDSGGKR